MRISSFRLLSFICLAILTFYFTGCSPQPIATDSTPANTSGSNIEVEILEQINRHRQSKGLKVFQSNAIIAAEAEKHSQNMASGKTSFSHAGFSSRVKRISNQLGKIDGSAENVAYGSKTAKEVVDGWLKSCGHRENIEGRFTLTGIGVARDGKGAFYFTQIFINK